MSYLYREEAHEGQGLVEYALILVLIALVVLSALTALGNGVFFTYNDIIVDGLRGVGMGT